MPKHHPSRVPRVPRVSRRSPSRVGHAVRSSLLCKRRPLMSGLYTGAERLEPTTSTKADDVQCANAHSTQGYEQSSMWHQSRRAEKTLPPATTRRSLRHTGRSLTMLTVSKLVPPGNLASVCTDHTACELLWWIDRTIVPLFDRVSVSFFDTVFWPSCDSYLFH